MWVEVAGWKLVDSDETGVCVCVCVCVCVWKGVCGRVKVKKVRLGGGATLLNTLYVGYSQRVSLQQLHHNCMPVEVHRSWYWKSSLM